jgi:hypothetical protein
MREEQHKQQQQQPQPGYLCVYKLMSYDSFRRDTLARFSTAEGIHT